jgi:hypothetical protein
MIMVYMDTHVMERRVGDVALACPLRRRVVACEVFEARAYQRLWCVRLTRGEVVRRELRDSRGPRRAMGSRLPRRTTAPLLPIDGPAPRTVRRWNDLAELVELTNPPAIDDARAMEARDAALRAEREGSRARLTAMVERIVLADFAAQRARTEGTGQALNALMLLSSAAAALVGLTALAVGQWWSWLLLVPAAVLAVKALHRSFLGGRAVARKVVRGVLAESLAQLAPSETELRYALDAAAGRQSDAARYLKDADVRLMLGSGVAMAA